MKKYLLINSINDLYTIKINPQLAKLDDFSDLDISFEHPMFQRLSKKLCEIDPQF